MIVKKIEVGSLHHKLLFLLPAAELPPVGYARPEAEIELGLLCA